MYNNTGYEFIGWEALLQVWLPRALGAIVILIAAWFIGKAIKWAIAKGVDRIPGAAKANLSDNPKHSVGASLGDVAFWLIVLFGVVAALGVLNLGGVVTPLNTLLNQVAAFLPGVLGAALIFFIGFVVATLAKRVVEAALTAAGADAWLDRVGLTRSTGSSGVSSAIGTLVFVLILIPITIAALEQLSIDSLTVPAVAVLSMVLAAIPRVIVAAILLAIGWFIGRWVAQLIERILPATGFDRSIQGLANLSSAKRAEPPATGATPYAGDVTPATAAAVQVIVGGVIIAAGVIIGDLLANAIDKGTGGADRFASTIVRWATIALATAMGLSFMGIADDIVLLAFGLILGAAAIATALAFGLGGRDAAGRVAQTWADKITRKSGETDRRLPTS